MTSPARSTDGAAGPRPVRRLDTVELLERLYGPETDWHRWGNDVIDTVCSPWDKRRIMLGVVGHREGLTELVPLHLIGELPPPVVEGAGAFFASLEAETIATLWYPGKPVITHSEILPSLAPRRVAELAQARFGAADCLGAFAYPLPGVVVVLSILLDEAGTLTPVERRYFRRVAAHLEGATRLRLRPEAAVAAVLRADGKLVDAADDDIARQRDHLARQIRAVEQTRQRGARDDPDAIRHWRALVDGAYTIVPRQSGGWSARREYLFVRNGSLARRDARLGMREAEVVRQLARGLSQKEVAYALGISEGAVSAALERARVRLGLANRLDLVRVARASFGLVAQPLTNAALTSAERAVLSLLREGLTNADIARLRGASQHTVANQVASILKKTSAASRRELAVRPDEVDDA